MRHGHSPNAADAGVSSDAERPLSERGHGEARAQAEKLKKNGDAPRLILHSPLRRAVETAREAAAVLGAETRVFVPLSNELGPEDLAKSLVETLAKEQRLLLVGHQPQVGEFSAWLCGQLIDFRPAGLAAMELDDKPAPRKARLLWAESP